MMQAFLSSNLCQTMRVHKLQMQKFFAFGVIVSFHVYYVKSVKLERSATTAENENYNTAVQA